MLAPISIRSPLPGPYPLLYYDQDPYSYNTIQALKKELI